LKRFVLEFPGDVLYLAEPDLVEKRSLCKVQETADELAILLATGFINGRHARVIPMNGSRHVNRNRGAQLYVMSGPSTWLYQTIRIREIAQITIPMPNRKETVIFFDNGIFSLHKTGVGRRAIEISTSRMMMWLVR